MTSAQMGVNPLITYEGLCNQVADIIDPLIVGTPVTTFCATRIFDTGAVTDLSNDYAWTSGFYQNTALFDVPAYDDFIEGRHLWLHNPKHKPFSSPAYFQLAQAYINVDSAMTVVKRHETYTDLFVFASEKSDMNLLNYFVQTPSDIDRILDRFELQSSALQSKVDPLVAYDQFASGASVRGEFMKAWLVRANDILSDYLGERINLTPREFQIFSYSIRGYSAKQIARELKISYRTVEGLIQAGRMKLNCARICEVALLFVKADTIKQVISLTECDEMFASF